MRAVCFESRPLELKLKQLLTEAGQLTLQLLVPKAS